MIQITESAQTHFRRLLDAQGGDAVGIRLSALHPGTPKADVRLEFAEKGDLDGGEWAVDCEGFTLFVDGGTASYLDGAEIDYRTNATGGELNIRAPKIKGSAPKEGASIPEQVRWLLDTEINPQRLPGLRHGRRHAEAGHREDADGEGAGHHRGA